MLPGITATDFKSCAHADGCGAVEHVIASSRSAELSVKLAAVNREVNRLLRYQDDAEAFGVLDRWSPPDGTMERGRGVDISIVVLRDTRRNVHHAVLAVRLDDGYAILDNLKRRVLPDRAIRGYQPLYSLPADGMWIHGRRQTILGGPLIQQLSSLVC